MAKIEAKKVSTTESDSGQNATVLPSAPPSPSVPLSKDNTRLVRIQAAKQDGNPLICELFEVAFSTKPKFEALSYMWGKDPANCSITMNDASERNSHVRIMRHIYFRARTVIVWLGERYVDYEAVLPDLRALGYFEPPNQPQVDPSSTQLSEKSHQFKIAEELYNDGYWNRLWIVQEIGVARDIKVCLGNSVVEWTPFIHFISMHTTGNRGPAKLERQRQQRYVGSMTLLQLLQDHEDAVCQDRKDKVCGLIGLATGAGDFIIDCEKYALEIWTYVMEFFNRRNLLAKNDILAVGHLVMSSLVGTDCAPLQQILQTCAPRQGDSVIITNTEHYGAFELQAVILGCVKHTGPSPEEIAGDLGKADQWTQEVQGNYQDVGRVHQENDTLICTILELDEKSMSTACFDSRSAVQWSVRSGLEFYGVLVRSFQSKIGTLDGNQDSQRQKTTGNSRLF
ncbi:hypothetical protein EDB81DRAFT_761542 [Dactylonectria macrodidyma]|uniref:Heterokaryon incompatibility domain-containing protein n=1 Tax=Dactylonectria macrodidyma TaxID=307937 RepID=A0A9P9J4P4_9HYPO|nr:hypothetical protein EDB81DRAFT_761542 [Dactylonectria macrodidyma]